MLRRCTTRARIQITLIRTKSTDSKEVQNQWAKLRKYKSAQTPNELPWGTAVTLISLALLPPAFALYAGYDRFVRGNNPERWILIKPDSPDEAANAELSADQKK